jgi:aminomethyltransferase
MMAEIERAYSAARTGAVMMDAAAWGRLRLTGSTRLDFLHRLSTNDVAKLQPGQGAATIFTTPIARIIDRTIVYAREADVLLITSRGNQGRVAQWLRKYIFFNDDVQVKDVTAETAMIALYGVGAAEAIRQVGGEDVSDLPRHHWRQVSLAGQSTLIARADPIGGSSFHLIGDGVSLAPIWKALAAAGVVPLGEATYQVLRVEAGQPEFGRELGDDYLPLEANLWGEVSFTKGCYTGQEIIARMESRHKLAKQLTGLRFAAEVALPASLWAGDAEIGVVTSVVPSPALGWIGLGYVKPAQGTAGQLVESRSGERRVEAQTCTLPFAEA